MANDVAGTVASGFEGVRAEFERNFTDRDELGAAFAAVRGGELVVDLWGGVRDRVSGARWGRDTLQLIFSGTKGLVAVCILLLLERGELELEAPVARYWPDFGKEEIRVRDVLGHTARLPGLDTPAALTDLLDDRGMAAALAAQAPSADRRAGLCYHALTYGWLCGELVRHVSGRSVGRFFANEVADALGLEIWIGLPEEHEGRVATLELWRTWPASAPVRRETLARDALLRSIWGNPPVLDPDGFPWNERAFHAAEIPALGAIAAARSVAGLYAGLTRILSRATIELGTTTLSNGWDGAHGVPRHFAAGFELQTELRHLGPPRDAFGHGGAGGSIHGCWPGQRIGFSYATNLLRDDEGDDSRARALLGALHHAAAKEEQ